MRRPWGSYRNDCGCVPRRHVGLRDRENRSRVTLSDLAGAGGGLRAAPAARTHRRRATWRDSRAALVSFPLATTWTVAACEKSRAARGGSPGSVASLKPQLSTR